MFNPNPWLKLSIDTFWLGAESSQVVALRMMKLAGGGSGAAAEAQRMVAEKVSAAMAAQTQLALGAMSGSPHAGPAKAVALYRRKVRANRRRLAREA
ncbi:hypothetical protein ASE17_03695 [Phenylobacterium sp. Root77]|jgi:hypothetical protein|uniref:hypothetical protein n=1 Tax=unclassified Phenylobacterium TaxID=2640670 RepID=UPI0006FF6E7A|nr:MULTISPECIES: hypothetical protein [unclassified Phenylobacterium]KQW71987.1 hypothetical protein ASC73_07920 [Phenylobacterium sp. Root1277]KQW94908.1 hypothetical protein ASC79_04065 [Phenylobacterium sp. Root1290]KRC44602.1 hypothetical protein ASE17_03695 [Phenylobacterium sp. Root77]